MNVFIFLALVTRQGVPDAWLRDVIHVYWKRQGVPENKHIINGTCLNPV